MMALRLGRVLRGVAQARLRRSEREEKIKEGRRREIDRDLTSGEKEPRGR